MSFVFVLNFHFEAIKHIYQRQNIERSAFHIIFIEFVPLICRMRLESKPKLIDLALGLTRLLGF